MKLSQVTFYQQLQNGAQEINQAARQETAQGWWENRHIQHKHIKERKNMNHANTAALTSSH